MSNEIPSNNPFKIDWKKLKIHPLKKPRIRNNFTQKVRKQILTQQNYLCKICITYLDVYDFDHIDGDSSNNSIQNCQALCPTCHRRKTKLERKKKKFKKIKPL